MELPALPYVVHKTNKEQLKLFVEKHIKRKEDRGKVLPAKGKLRGFSLDRDENGKDLAPILKSLGLGHTSRCDYLFFGYDKEAEHLACFLLEVTSMHWKVSDLKKKYQSCITDEADKQPDAGIINKIVDELSKEIKQKLRGTLELCCLLEGKYRSAGSAISTEDLCYGKHLDPFSNKDTAAGKCWFCANYATKPGKNSRQQLRCPYIYAVIIPELEKLKKQGSPSAREAKFYSNICKRINRDIKQAMKKPEPFIALIADEVCLSYATLEEKVENSCGSLESLPHQ